MNDRSNPTFVLIPGAGGSATYWYRLVEELRQRGRETIAVGLPAADDSAGLAEYADAVVAAIGERRRIVLVAQSMGGFTAPLVCERVPVELLVLLNAMVPAPGESPGQWWENTGQPAAAAAYASSEGRPSGGAFDPLVEFFHDVPDEVRAVVFDEPEPVQSGTPFEKAWPLEKWPDVPIRFLQGRDDRFFPLEFQRRVARERLGITVDEMPGGHLLALSRPRELADRLEGYLS
ncbi:MAG TPA: alpha/beta fold hydrolase [Pseudonocardia sp.]